MTIYYYLKKTFKIHYFLYTFGKSFCRGGTPDPQGRKIGVFRGKPATPVPKGSPGLLCFQTTTTFDKLWVYRVC